MIIISWLIVISGISIMSMASGPSNPYPTNQLVATATPDRVFVGQAITYTVRDYRQQLAPGYNRIEPPIVSDATVTTMPSPTAPTLVYQDKQRYYVYNRLKQQVIPEKPGQLQISPTISYGNQTRLSNPVSVQVMPLPQPPNAVNHPVSIGQFDLSVATISDRLRIDDPITVRVSIQADGVLTPEAIAVGRSTVFRHYLDKQTKQGDYYYLDYVFIPTVAGRYTLPAIRLWTFDPETAAYAWLTSESQAVTIDSDTDDTNSTQSVIMPSQSPINLAYAWRLWAENPRDANRYDAVVAALETHPDGRYGVATPNIAQGLELFILIGLLIILRQQATYRRTGISGIITVTLCLIYWMLSPDPIRLVSSDKIMLYTLPSVSYPAGVYLHRDLPVYYHQAHNNWVEIQLGTGERGWCHATDLIAPNAVIHPLLNPII